MIHSELGEHAVLGDEHRQRAVAAGAARGELVHALDVALLEIVEAGALERPARLLAVVADRDGDQAPQRVVTDT